VWVPYISLHWKSIWQLTTKVNISPSNGEPLAPDGGTGPGSTSYLDNHLFKANKLFNGEQSCHHQSMASRYLSGLNTHRDLYVGYLKLTGIRKMDLDWDGNPV